MDETCPICKTRCARWLDEQCTGYASLRFVAPCYQRGYEIEHTLAELVRKAFRATQKVQALGKTLGLPGTSRTEFGNAVRDALIAVEPDAQVLVHIDTERDEDDDGNPTAAT